MTNDAFTKTALTLIALLLALIVVENGTTSTTIAHAATGSVIQRAWEYKYVSINYKYVQNNAADMNLYAQSSTCHDDSAGENITCEGMSSRLGAQGWELIGYAPESFVVGWGGATTAEQLVFKRPK